MDSEKKGKKRPYVPPTIYELDVDPTQAMGATACNPTGAAASAACSLGDNPTVSCSPGPTECALF